MWDPEINDLYGYKPWELDELRPSQWIALVNYHAKRMRANQADG